MQILVLSDKPLSRRLGDGLRVLGLLQQMQGEHRFHLIYFSRDGETLEPEVLRLFGSATMVSAPRPKRSSWPRRVYKALTGSDFKQTSDEMRAAIAAALADLRPDLLLDVGASALPNLPAGLAVPLVVDSIDEPVLREMRALRSSPWQRKAAHLYQAWRFWNYGRQFLSRAVLNIYVSEVDAGLYARFFPERTVAVVPNGVDIDHFSPMPATPASSYVVFEGNMNFAPNVDGACRLVREILPLVASRVPDVRIGIVGRDPADAVRALASPAVEVTGTVDDVRPYLARAAVFACPMQLGSGMKNKILQAWAMGRPVVATPACLGGLSAQDGKNILVRSEPRAFADAVCDLLTNPARASALGAAGRETVVREYSWQRQARKFDALLMNAVGRQQDQGDERRGAAHSEASSVMERTRETQS